MRIARYMFCLCFFIASGCGNEREVNIGGDESSIGAQVFIDGKLKGVMEEKIYKGDYPGIPKNAKYACADIRVPYNTFSLVVKKNGESIEKEIGYSYEMYIYVEFSKRKINGP